MRIEYRVHTARLSVAAGANLVDNELSDILNAHAQEGWSVHSIGDGVPTVAKGGVRTLDRLLVFERPLGEPQLLVEEEEGDLSNFL